MSAAKFRVVGSDYVGAFATASDGHAFVGSELGPKARSIIAENLGVDVTGLTIFGSGLVGMLARANSNGIIMSNLIDDRELDALKSAGLGINIGVIESGLNAVGNNVLANDRIAIVNPDYDAASEAVIRDTLGVEVVKAAIGGFKTVGANNILTNRGIVINNRGTDEDQERVDSLVGMKSVRSTANTGFLSIGIAAVSNSNGMVVGEATTGYEMARIMDGLGID